MIFDETNIKRLPWGYLRYQIVPYHFLDIRHDLHLEFVKSFLNFTLMDSLTPDDKEHYSSHINKLKEYVEDPLFEIELEKLKGKYK